MVCNNAGRMNEEHQKSLTRKIVVPVITFPRPQSALDDERRLAMNRQQYVMHQLEHSYQFGFPKRVRLIVLEDNADTGQ
jgi:hypothetical protein